MRSSRVLRWFVFLLSLANSVGLHAAVDENSSGCIAAVNAFLSSPDQRTFAALMKINVDGCWGPIGSSNSRQIRLNRWVRHGNRWAAQYSAKHLEQLDGGNLEDSLEALGLFSDHQMERLLLFAKEGLLSKDELCDALTMLPFTLADRPIAQLSLLRARRSKVVRITRSDLSEQKVQVLSAIDAFVSEIKAKR